jgi:integrase
MKLVSDKEINDYVESKRGLWSDRTLPVVRTTLRTMASGFFSPDKVFKKLLEEGRTKYTIKTYFAVASRFEKEIYRTKRYQQFLQNHTSTFRNCYKDKTRHLKPEQYEKFLNMYLNQNPNMYNLLVLMGTAGLRVSEALSATWEDIQDGFIKVIGKGSKQRVIPFDPKVLIKSGETGKIVGRLAFRFLFNRDLKPYTPHDFRAYYATYIANHPELSIKDAALLLGHSSITTTSRYVRTDLNRIAKVLKKK